MSVSACVAAGDPEQAPARLAQLILLHLRAEQQKPWGLQPSVTKKRLEDLMFLYGLCHIRGHLEWLESGTDPNVRLQDPLRLRLLLFEDRPQHVSMVHMLDNALRGVPSNGNAQPLQSARAEKTSRRRSSAPPMPGMRHDASGQVKRATGRSGMAAAATPGRPSPLPSIPLQESITTTPDMVRAAFLSRYATEVGCVPLRNDDLSLPFRRLRPGEENLRDTAADAAAAATDKQDMEIDSHYVR
jgi:hypothetical protein